MLQTPVTLSQNISTGLDFLAQQVHLGALRWLHAIDLDPHSQTYGVCDREYWAWKTKDFANATWQTGLAGFLDAQPLLELSPEEIQILVQAVLRGTHSIQRGDGSFEEAYPLESSYCVTALVQFSLLYSYLKYPAVFSDTAKKITFSIVQKTDHFLDHTPETHGIISNHRATALMARHLATRFLGNSLSEAEYEAFACLQHPTEGWLPEYGGADPGYQTLLNFYLAAAHSLLPLPQAFQNLFQKSQQFTHAFCLPDGSYAGEIGSRGTSVVYPGGLFPLETSLPPGEMVHWFLLNYTSRLHAMTPVAVDAGNFSPVLNNWAFAWQQARQSVDRFSEASVFNTQVSSEVVYPEAGLYRMQTPEAVVILSRRSGAIRRVVRTSKGFWKDGSLVSLTCKDRTTQGGVVSQFEYSPTRCVFSILPISRNQTLNSPLRMVLLRLMAVCLSPFPALHRELKKRLAQIVMGRNTRSLGPSIRIEIDRSQLHCPVWHNASADWRAQQYGYHQHMASANTFERRALCRVLPIGG